AAMDQTSGPMRWGVDDCGLWCGDILKVALGYDACSELRGRYLTRAEALELMGKGALPAAIRRAARRHGWKPVKAGSEEVGDIGVMVVGKAAATLICRARGWFVGRSD